MRRDYIIAIILAVAAIPAGATLMVAPDYLHLTGVAVPLTFWGGIGLTFTLIIFAAVVALRSERKAKQAPAVSPLCSSAARDVALLDAIWRIFTGVWGERRKFWDGGDPNQNPDFDNFYRICLDIRQKAFDGTLPIWATRKGSQLYEAVPLKFWRERSFAPQPMMDPAWPDVWVEHSQGPTQYHRSTEWENFSTNREIIDRLWSPPREVSG
jgi:hypothetical protein